MSNEVCGDNRFEIIEAAKKKLIDATNIETCSAEMAVIDSILFRMWQMKWLPGQEQTKSCVNTSLKADQFCCSVCRAYYDIARLDISIEEDTGIPQYCPNCGAKIVEGEKENE